MYDFANILFSGPCNARCPFCIGRQIDPKLNVDNLDLFPPRSLERFLEMVRINRIRQVVVTGTNTDPQLYTYEAQLLVYLRAVLPPEVRFSLHTNGRLALCKLDVFNSYDRVAISLPSFNEKIYRQMMGVPGVPDLAAILNRARIPVKISCVVTRHNRAEIGDFLEACHSLGVRRVVLRKLFGELQSWRELVALDTLPLDFRGGYCINPVYDYDGMEITLWDFGQSDSRSINLFSSGVISPVYLLAETRVVDKDMQGPSFAGKNRHEMSAGSN